MLKDQLQRGKTNLVEAMECKHQRELAKAIKIARALALLPPM